MDARARFTRMQDGTAEEFALIEAAETDLRGATLPGGCLTRCGSPRRAGRRGTRFAGSSTACSRRPGPSAMAGRLIMSWPRWCTTSATAWRRTRTAATPPRCCTRSLSEELCWIVSHHPLFQMYFYGPHTWAATRTPGRRYRGHPWFDAAVEFCERYDENCFDPAYDWLPPRDPPTHVEGVCAPASRRSPPRGLPLAGAKGRRAGMTPGPVTGSAAASWPASSTPGVRQIMLLLTNFYILLAPNLRTGEGPDHWRYQRRSAV